VRADVDQNQDLGAGLGMRLFAEDDAAIVIDRAGMKSGQSTAQVVRSEAGIVEVLGHAAQGAFDSVAKFGMFADYLPK
jgi:hypothetical protein